MLNPRCWYNRTDLMCMMGPDSASEMLVTECSFVPKKCRHVHISSPERSLCFLFGFPDALFILMPFRTITLHRNVCLLFIHWWMRKQSISIQYTRNSFYNILYIGFEGTQRLLWLKRLLFNSTGWTGNKTQTGNLKWLPTRVHESASTYSTV